MTINTRNCFWFGTEDRADWFATPLAGADSSPSAWGADGTLLNGGGWALNSWGSHKRYTYEWPASSSRETAQRMKSYRDGTYGRGLLYFLEPTIFTTNVLPAHWADPSMSLDNEAPSLVYGVDPTPVATSGGANLGLPITSAQYDLSGVPPRSIPTPDSSVFIPIPTGHTLFLGAFYSSTGTGGVFATPVNGNGTMGTAVKLTEKSNSDTEVVTDQFSGDLRGVRLWVGRSDTTASSVTIAAMNGRLLETSKVVTYGPWVETDRNRFINPVPANTTGFAAQNATQAMSGGGITLTSTLTTAADGVGLSWIANGQRLPVTPGEVVALSADSMSLSARRANLGVLFYDATDTLILAGVTYSTNFGGTAAFQRGTVTATAPAGAVTAGFYFRKGRGDQINTADTITFRHFRFGTPGAYFDGSTNPTGELERTSWTGPPNASESLLETRTRTGNPAKEAQLKRGPWIGGQGHSGCRFAGMPSYITNSPIEGGRIGFAASFIEVGSWVYG